MDYIFLIEMILLLLVIFFILRSVLVERNHKKKGPFITIGVYSGVAIFNIILILFIVASSFISIYNVGKSSFFSISNIYILVLVIFIFYQFVISIKVVFCKDGICYLGKFYSYKKITRVQFAKSKDKFTIIIFTGKATLTFKVSKNNKILMEESFKKYNITPTIIE